jgi:bacterioferritin
VEIARGRCARGAWRFFPPANGDPAARVLCGWERIESGESNRLELTGREERAMKGNTKVLELLNEALSEELTAINQYFLHAEICENSGYKYLHDQIRKESIDEMKHAEKLIERILFLEGQPNMLRYGQIKIGTKVDDMLGNDLSAEYAAVALYNRGIALCADVGDHGTRDMLQGILKDEEGHTDWLETQLSVIKEIGLANYLSQQIEANRE